MQTQQGALLELQAWLGAAECQLEEYCNKINKNSCTNNDLAQFLKYFKVEWMVVVVVRAYMFVLIMLFQWDSGVLLALIWSDQETFVGLLVYLSMAYFSGVSDRDVCTSDYSGLREPAITVK